MSVTALIVHLPWTKRLHRSEAVFLGLALIRNHQNLPLALDDYIANDSSISVITAGS